MEKVSLRRLRYALRGDAQGQYLKALGVRIGEYAERYVIKGIPGRNVTDKIFAMPIGSTRRYKKYFFDKGKLWKSKGVFQSKAPSYGDPRRTPHADFDVNPIISTKALKAIAAATTAGALSIGALGVKILKRNKKEKSIA